MGYQFSFHSELWWARSNRGAGVAPSGWSTGRGFPPPRRWRGLRSTATSPENFSLFTLEKVHFGGYLKHSGILIMKLWIAVDRMLHGCGTDSVSFSSTDCSSLGLKSL